MTYDEMIAKQRLEARARAAVRSAIQRGSLVRKPCEVCGDEPSDGHHADHNRPLQVRWLCRLHHRWISAYDYTVEEMQAAREDVLA